MVDIERLRLYYNKISRISKKPWMYFQGKYYKSTQYIDIIVPIEEWKENFHTVKCNKLALFHFWNCISMMQESKELDNKVALVISYAEEWLINKTPYTQFEEYKNEKWTTCVDHPVWHTVIYRMKKSIVIVNGYEVINGDKNIQYTQQVYIPSLESVDFVSLVCYSPDDHKHLLDAGMLYHNPLHAIKRCKAMLGIDPLIDPVYKL